MHYISEYPDRVPCDTDLRFIKAERGEKRTYRLCEKVAAHYKEISDTLGLTLPQRNNIEHNTTVYGERVERVFQEWLQNANQLPNKYPLSWDGLRQILFDSNLGQIATEFFNVLKDC